MPLREKLALVVGLGILGFVPVGYLMGGEDLRLWWSYGSKGRPIYEEGLERLAEIERVQAERGLSATAILEVRRALPGEFWQSEAWPDHEWRYELGPMHGEKGPFLSIGEYDPLTEGGDHFELWYSFAAEAWDSNS